MEANAKVVHFLALLLLFSAALGCIVAAGNSPNDMGSAWAFLTLAIGILFGMLVRGID